MGASLVAISVDTAEDSASLANRLRLTFPILVDEGLKTATAYGVAMQGRDIAIPALFVVDKTGRVAWKYIGETMTDRPHSATITQVLQKLAKE